MQFQATPFHYLCQNSAVTAEAIRVMLKHSADPNTPNNVRTSPSFSFLAVASSALVGGWGTGWHDLTLTLAVAGLQIGNSPLHYLCENYATSVAMLSEVIDSKKANLTITNSVRLDCRTSLSMNNEQC